MTPPKCGPALIASLCVWKARGQSYSGHIVCRFTLASGPLPEPAMIAADGDLNRVHWWHISLMYFSPYGAVLMPLQELRAEVLGGETWDLAATRYMFSTSLDAIRKSGLGLVAMPLEVEFFQLVESSRPLGIFDASIVTVKRLEGLAPNTIPFDVWPPPRGPPREPRGPPGPGRGRGRGNRGRAARLRGRGAAPLAVEDRQPEPPGIHAEQLGNAADEHSHASTDSEVCDSASEQPLDSDEDPTLGSRYQ